MSWTKETASWRLAKLIDRAPVNHDGVTMFAAIEGKERDYGLLVLFESSKAWNIILSGMALPGSLGTTLHAKVFGLGHAAVWPTAEYLKCFIGQWAYGLMRISDRMGEWEEGRRVLQALRKATIARTPYLAVEV